MPSPPTIDWTALTAARRALIHNPYAVDPSSLTAADAWFKANMSSVPRAMVAMVERGEPLSAKQLVLTAAHAAARAGDIASALPILERSVEHIGSPGIELSVKDLRRLAWAAQRFNMSIRALVGRSEPMDRLRSILWRGCFGPNLFEALPLQATLRQQNLLLLGEPGTGKELVANVIQAAAFTDGPDAAPSQSLNCSAIPKDLFESELFGAEKGAHSSAQERRIGRLAAASGGVLFLDEVADLPLDVQAKLLSVLANGKVTPLGSNKEQSIDVRCVSATSRPILTRVQEQTFRDDLFGRLGTIVNLPPLRVRRDDILEIGHALYAKHTASRQGTTLSPTLEALFGANRDAQFTFWLQEEATRRPWAGNVRELEGAVRAHVLGMPETPMPEARAAATESDVPAQILAGAAKAADVADWYFKRVFQLTGANQSRTGEVLDMHRSTVKAHVDRLFGHRGDRSGGGRGPDTGPRE